MRSTQPDLSVEETCRDDGELSGARVRLRRGQTVLNVKKETKAADENLARGEGSVQKVQARSGSA